MLPPARLFLRAKPHHPEPLSLRSAAVVLDHLQAVGSSAPNVNNVSNCCCAPNASYVQVMDSITDKANEMGDAMTGRDNKDSGMGTRTVCMVTVVIVQLM